ncbi:MAG: N-acetylmuramoyl-L-alanine amidase [Clostridia bacterium]
MLIKFKKIAKIIILIICSIMFFNVTAMAAETDKIDEICKHEKTEKHVLLNANNNYSEISETVCLECGTVTEIVLPTIKDEGLGIDREDCIVKEPTCLIGGIKADIDINNKLINIRYLYPLGHSYSEYEKKNNITEIKTCSRCNCVKERATKTLLEGKHCIYLSPSSQFENAYYSKDTTEGEMMNLLTDKVEERLASYTNLTVHRNKKENDVLANIALGNSHGSNVEAYISLHSNGAKGTARGPLVIYDSRDEERTKLANIMYDNLLEIYPDKDLGRGLLDKPKYYEIYKVDAPSIIMEVAFHDNKEDEAWIRNNLDKIADSIVKGIIEYLNVEK